MLRELLEETFENVSKESLPRRISKETIVRFSEKNLKKYMESSEEIPGFFFGEFLKASLDIFGIDSGNIF